MIIQVLEIENRSVYKSGTYLNLDKKRFGLIRQRVINKVNLNNNFLKLKDSDSEKSIYPMVDEFGYALIDQFIFKSNWDSNFHWTYLINSDGDGGYPIN
jgi:hypothetical protein